MKESERLLRIDIESCVNILHEIVDTDSAKSISIYSKRTNENEQWLEELKHKLNVRPEEDLQKFQQLKDDQIAKLNEIEQKVDYYERLCVELEEIQNELEVKTKLEQKRRSRIKDK